MVLEIDMVSRYLVGLLDVPARCCELVYCCGFVKKIKKKIIWRKTVAIHNVFKKKNYKAKILTNLISKK
jgi:hypothetical protein